MSLKFCHESWKYYYRIAIYLPSCFTLAFQPLLNFVHNKKNAKNSTGIGFILLDSTASMLGRLSMSGFNSTRIHKIMKSSQFVKSP